GEERRVAPQAAPATSAPAPASPAPSNERTVDRDSNWRRFGQPDHQSAPPSESRRSIRESSPPPTQLFGRRESDSRPQNLGNVDRTPRMSHSDRQLEIHRPITVERAPRNEGGGHAAPAPRSEAPRGDGGGRAERSGGGSRR